jgi:outer membrane protein assembly factor BamB
VAGGLAYLTVGMRGPLYAVKLGGSGRRDPAEAIAWKHTDSTPDTCCPVVANGLLFLVSDNGIATCLDAKTGQRQWRNRLPGRHFKASPLAAAGRVYVLSHDGQCTVIEASQTFRVVSQNRLDDEFTASPAPSDGRIYLRGRQSLYALGP